MAQSNAAFIAKTKRTALLRLASLKKFAKPVSKSPPVQVFNPTIPSSRFIPVRVSPGVIAFRPPQPLRTTLPIMSAGSIFKGRPTSGRIIVPQSALIPPGRILLRPLQINVAGNSINESPTSKSNINFPNRLKNIEMGSTEKSTFNVALIAIVAVGLIFFFSK